jgi:hypothetical protein
MSRRRCLLACKRLIDGLLPHSPLRLDRSLNASADLIQLTAGPRSHLIIVALVR